MFLRPKSDVHPTSLNICIAYIKVDGRIAELSSVASKELMGAARRAAVVSYKSAPLPLNLEKCAGYDSRLCCA